MSLKCKYMALYVIHGVNITEDDISEDKQGSDEDCGKSKGHSKYDEVVCESKDIERKEMLKIIR